MMSCFTSIRRSSATRRYGLPLECGASVTALLLRQLVNRMLIPAFGGLILCITIGCSTFRQSQEKAEIRGREDALETALRYTRQALKDYSVDHGKPPSKLQDLVSAGYFNHLPVDPMTDRDDWTLEFYPCESPSPCEKRIKDVHSSSTKKSSKGTFYSEW
jgi:hypothetical protein